MKSEDNYNNMTRSSKKIATSTRNLRAHGVDAPDPILGTDEPNESISSQLIGAEQDDEHSLETTLLNTDVYSKACSRRLSTDFDDDHNDDKDVEGDVDEAIDDSANEKVDDDVHEGFDEDVDKDVDEEFDEDDACTVTEDVIDTPTLAIMAPEIQASLKRLRVSSIFAFTLADHLSWSSDELLFDQSQWLVDITRLSDTVYHCIDNSSKYGVKRLGRFDRTKVAIHIKVEGRIGVRTASAGISLEGTLQWEEGDLLMVYVSLTLPSAQSCLSEIRAICHSTSWWVHGKPPPIADEEQLGTILVCDIDLDEAMEREIDRLLLYFACPMPALAAMVNRNNQFRQIEKILSKGDAAKTAAVCAHCISFRELRKVARILASRTGG